tara:strand:+ start:1498 stop:2373 length:876 start_codon:yes stop_codon:yes gene_type:complete
MNRLIKIVVPVILFVLSLSVSGCFVRPERAGESDGALGRAEERDDVSKSGYSVDTDESFRVGGLERREVYLLIGQSNMAGRAEVETGDEAVIEGCELFNAGGEWEEATNPLNRFSTIRKKISMQRLGPGYGFAKRMRELRPDVSIGLVVNARGGTSIQEWAKGTQYYDEAICRARAAQSDGRLTGILWHQGESDGKRSDSYLEKLTVLISDLRADLGDPELPFVAGLVEQDDRDGKVARVINDVILQLPDAVPNTAVASSEGLLTSDGTHFDSAGQRLLGARFADALLSLE